MWPWQTVVASAVGAAIPFVPIYLFGFRQVIAGKDATIEHLKGRVEQLKAECAPTVILEKKALIEELETRAKESAEAEDAITRVTQNLEHVSATVKVLTSQVQERTATVGTIPELVKRKTSNGTQIGVLMGLRSLMKVRYWWHGMSLDVTDPIAKMLDEFVAQECNYLTDLRERIRDGHVLKVEEFTAVQEDMNRLLAQGRAQREELLSKVSSAIAAPQQIEGEA
jgi:hypothetical protein